MQNSHKPKKARIVFQDSRILEGYILKCDFHMNTLISNSIEYRLNSQDNKWKKRNIGLCVIRGNSISTISVL